MCKLTNVIKVLYGTREPTSTHSFVAYSWIWDRSSIGSASELAILTRTGWPSSIARVSSTLARIEFLLSLQSAGWRVTWSWEMSSPVTEDRSWTLWAWTSWITGAGWNGLTARPTTLSAIAGNGHNGEGLCMNPNLGMISLSYPSETTGQTGKISYSFRVAHNGGKWVSQINPWRNQRWPGWHR